MTQPDGRLFSDPDPDAPRAALVAGTSDALGTRPRRWARPKRAGKGSPPSGSTTVRIVRIPSAFVSSSGSPGSPRARIVTAWPRERSVPAIRAVRES